MSVKPNYEETLERLVAEQFNGKISGKARAAAGKQFQHAKSEWEEANSADVDANGPQLRDAIELVDDACFGAGTEIQRHSIAKRILTLQRKAYISAKWERTGAGAPLETAVDDLGAQAPEGKKRAKVDE